MRTKKVTVVPYDNKWPAAFAQIKRELLSALGEYAVAIEHVGSTSVPGLSAKPIIDIDVVIPSYACFAAVAEKLAEIGYRHEGDLGIKDREAFKYADKPHLLPHHLYVCPKDSEELHRHLVFRDYLRTHPEDAAAYGKIKREAAALYPADIDAYMAHKNACIEKIYRKCGL